MPIRTLTLDSTGTANWRAPGKLTALTLLNPSTTSVQFKLDNTGDSIVLASQKEVEFEEEELANLQEVEFISGTAGNTIQVEWAT